MNFSEDILQQIEAYLNDTMTANQIAAFENELNENPELAEAIAINKKMRLQYGDNDWDFIQDDHENKDLKTLESMLKSKEFQDKKKAIQNAGTSYFNSEETKSKDEKKYKLYYLLAAAAVLILSFNIFFTDNSTNSLEIYNANSNWSELPSLVSRSETNVRLLSKGENAFLSKDYKLAEESFKAYVVKQETINVNALLYLGISQLELNNYNAALESFKKIIASKTLDQSKGYWYTVLVYLKKDDKENAIKTLKIIAQNPEYHNHNKAKQILEGLN